MKKVYIILSFLAILSLSACSNYLNREVLTVEPHDDLPPITSTSESRVDGYLELLSTIEKLVENRERTAVLYLYNLDSEMTDDAFNLAEKHIMLNTALGAYSVENMEMNSTTILSYDQVEIEIEYKSGIARASEIIKTSGEGGIKRLFENGFSELETSLVANMSGFVGGEGEIIQIMEESYLSIFDISSAIPNIEVLFTPRHGENRVAEISITYSEDIEVLEAKTNQTRHFMAIVLDNILNLTGDEKIREIASYVRKLCYFNEEGEQTAFSAFFSEQGANAMGISKALALTYSEEDVFSTVVKGEKNGEEHYWNIVSTSNGYRHIDILGEQIDEFLTDQELETLGYVWNRESVPACV